MQDSSNTLVTVIVPVYNHARFVAEALQSVFRQTHTPIQLVVIDDGSNDDSVRAIEKFLGGTPLPHGIQVDFARRAHRGAASAINEGLQSARGEFIGILNSDDLYAPDRIRVCLAAARARQAAFVFTHVEAISDNGERLPPGHPWRRWYNRVLMHSLDIHPSTGIALLFNNLIVSSGNFFLHRSILDSVGLLRDYRYGHDLDFALRVCRHTEPQLVTERLYSYRVHERNTIDEKGGAAESEVAEIIHGHLRALLAVPPANPFSDCFETWPSVSSRPNVSPHLKGGLDRFLEAPAGATPEPASAPATPAKRPARSADRRRAPDIVLLTHELSRTGGPFVVVGIARCLHDLGRVPRILSPVNGPLRSEFDSRRIRLKIIPGSKAQPNAASPPPRWPLLSRILASRNRHARRLRRGIARNTPLLVNSSGSWTAALPYFRSWRGPLFWYVHESIEPERVVDDTAVASELRALVGAGRIQMLFGSDATRTLWADRGFDGKVFYWSGIPASVEPTTSGAESAVARPRRTVLSVGTTPVRKGSAVLVEAFAHGRAQGMIPADVELCIVGLLRPSENAVARDLVRRVWRLGVQQHVRLVGVVPPSELRRYYDEAAVYVQASIMECLPLALLEAMACGLPIVTTDVDGCTEAIVHDQCGLVIAPNQVAQLAAALGALLNDRGRASRLGSAARHRFNDKFSLETTLPPLLHALFPGDLRASKGGAF